MSVADNQTRAAAWTRYWSQGVRNSCAGSVSDHYGSRTQQFWRAQCGGLGESDCLLELGCGNGSLIRLLQESGVAPGRIVAADLAQLDQSWLATLPEDYRRRVQLLPGTSAEALPIVSGSVTQVVSQYAFEYFAGEKVWREIQRVLAPRAAMTMVVHHQGSRFYQSASAENSHCGWLLSADGPLALAAQVLPLFAAAATPAGRAALDADAGARGLRDRFNQVFQDLEKRAAGEFGDILHEAAAQIGRVLQLAKKDGEAVARQALQSLRQVVMDNRLRVAELTQAALDEAGIGAWRLRLYDMGMIQIEISEIHEQGHLFGWTLTAKR